MIIREKYIQKSFKTFLFVVMFMHVNTDVLILLPHTRSMKKLLLNNIKYSIVYSEEFKVNVSKVILLLSFI